jgi:hypothetical protein
MIQQSLLLSYLDGSEANHSRYVSMLIPVPLILSHHAPAPRAAEQCNAIWTTTIQLWMP